MTDRSIRFLSEADVRRVVTQSSVTAAIEVLYRAIGEGRARNFPVVREPLGHADAIFGFKSGFDSAAPALGVKAGGLWPGNRARGLPNHQSTIVLFDPDSGAPSALVCGTYLTALRTAAASALSIRYLARREARVLGIVGSGGQAAHQVRAALAERNFERVVVTSRTTAHADALVEALAETGLPVERVGLEALCRAADVIITVALSFTPLVEAHWVRPGTHLACMGTDSVGKQELAVSLFRSATVFGDAPEQNVVFGECQHALAAGILTSEDVVSIGRVVCGAHPGRTAEHEITLFDSTGIGLQDIAAATHALAAAERHGSLCALAIEEPSLT